MNSELREVHSILGDRVGAWIQETASGLNGRLRATRVAELAHPVESTPEGPSTTALQVFLESTTTQYLDALLTLIHSILVRGLVVACWIAVLLPFLIAAVIDGFSQRKVKLANLGDQIPTAFAIGSHAVLALSAVPLLYLIAPITMTPLFMPLWALAIALPLGLAISHMQPVFSRS